ncbi:hypothetical protein COY27_02025 [Candidatus Woesearchaeota archaeon CG_4_10_14_0_2_um_filter_33_13]|nr:MAG: hypothetical protein COY27_02025 [Candidatus Woesearchaeota archaeon CG_4_10_14_0_2_um_filter_33_13]
MKQTSSIKGHWELFKEYVKLNLATALEYRFSFVVQTITMVLNDITWLIFWWIFFTKFGSLNGWQIEHILVLYALLNLSYGLAGMFFGNKNHISSMISEGRLDFYINFPKNILFHVLISRSNWFGVGDALFGLILAAITLSLKQWPLFLLLTLSSTIIFVSFAVLAHSLAFYFGNSSETSRSLNMGIVTMSSYPSQMFGGVAKFLMLTVFPAGFISGIPVQLLYQFNWFWLISTILFSLMFLATSIYFFYKGLRKYESGSMITSRI